MNMTRNYGAEVNADIEAGEQPNLRTVQRAIAQLDALRAINAELLAACQAVIASVDSGERTNSISLVRAAIAKATQS